jgi:hypothetical protein
LETPAVHVLVSVPAPQPPPPHASVSPVLAQFCTRARYRLENYGAVADSLVQPEHKGSRQRARAAVTVILQVTTDSYLFVPLFREAFGLPRNFWPYNFERPASWELVVETMRAHFAHKEITPASVQIQANGYIDPHDQTRLLTSLETAHTDMITRITQFKAETYHWVRNGGAAD